MNADDILFQVSRRMDGDLSESERCALERALAESPSLLAEAEKFQALDDMLKTSARSTVEIDWTHHAKWIQANVESIREAHDLSGVDRLLSQWTRPVPMADADAFASGVLQRIRGEKRLSIGRYLWRIGAPLAAAAALFFALTTTHWPGGAKEPTLFVAIGPQIAAPVVGSPSAGEEKNVVSFERIAAAPPTIDESFVGLSVVGVAAQTMEGDDASSL